MSSKAIGRVLACFARSRLDLNKRLAPFGFRGRFSHDLKFGAWQRVDILRIVACAIGGGQMLKFAVKTVVYALLPTAFARVRAARAAKAVLQPRVPRPEWEGSGTGEVRRRLYESYDHYLGHQATKYAVMLEKRGGHERRTIVVYRIKFWLRFRRVIPLLPKDSKIICAGARDGTEVEVWHDLGYKNAVGFDINPGPNNPLVSKADFNHLPLADETADAIYSNCVDHAFELDLM